MIRLLDRTSGKQGHRMAVGAILLLLCFASTASARGRRETGCRKTAGDLLTACQKEAYSDYFVALANARNLSEECDRREATAEALQGLREALEECRDQREARIDWCEELEEDIYDPEIDPSDFVLPVTNPFFPLIPGTVRTYEKVTDEGTETVIISVLDETKEIMGVTCVVVQDTVFFNGELIEDTFDYFSQHVGGAAWYFGENSLTYENGQVVSVAGSWIGGVAGAKPGVVMQANPQAGDVYRQEFFLTEAEDGARVVEIEADVTVPFGMFSGCVHTQDLTPIQPDALEDKFYAPGIGLALETDPESGERLELIGVVGP